MDKDIVLKHVSRIVKERIKRGYRIKSFGTHGNKVFIEFHENEELKEKYRKLIKELGIIGWVEEDEQKGINETID